MHSTPLALASLALFTLPASPQATGAPVIEIVHPPIETSTEFGFGDAVDTDGELLLVGYPLDGKGSASLYDARTGDLIHELPTDGLTLPQWNGFGAAVLLHEDRAFVGIDGFGQSLPGGVAVYDVETGQQFALMKPEVGVPAPSFGASIATDGETIVVGQPRANSNEGAVFVFDYATGALRHELIGDGDFTDNEYFGISVAVDGRYVVVGAYGDPGDAEEPLFVDQGSVYVFDAETGERLGKYTEDDDPWEDRFDLFGLSVAVQGEVIAVGAPGARIDDGELGYGEVHLLDAATGATLHRLTTFDPWTSFGTDVDLRGNTLAVGTPYGLDASGEVVGVVQLYDATTGELTDTLVGGAPLSLAGQFGRSVALDRQAQSLAVGEPASDIGLPLSGGGAVRVFDLAYSEDWSGLGGASVGVEPAPVLVGGGPLTPNSFGALELSAAAPSAPLWVAVANESQPLPLFDGTLLANPVLLLVPGVSGAGGAFELDFQMGPSQLPSGTTIHAQAAILDPSAPSGVALSNAVVGRTP